jgi:hypothetical protein
VEAVSRKKKIKSIEELHKLLEEKLKGRVSSGIYEETVKELEEVFKNNGYTMMKQNRS